MLDATAGIGFRWYFFMYLQLGTNEKQTKTTVNFERFSKAYVISVTLQKKHFMYNCGEYS